MRTKLNITEGIFPMPVLMVATYNEDGSVNVMNAAWGTMQERGHVALNLTESHKTVKNIKARGAFTVSIADKDHMDVRRGVAGIFFMYKCAGAKAAQMASLDEVLAVAQKVKDRTRTVGFALSPCVIPELGHANFSLAEGEMAMGMGIHGEPGIWNGPVKTAKELAEESLDTILGDMPLTAGEEVAVLINGLGATSIEELYILSGNVAEELERRGIRIARTYVGEFATSMEMAGASITIMHTDEELNALMKVPVATPFFTQA